MNKNIESFPSDVEILPNEFLEKYKNKQPNWGFNGLGYIVYKRCVEKNTLILCDDLSWRPACDLEDGDGIIGFDEFSVSKYKNKTRYIRYGHVTHNKIEKAQCLGVELEDGTIIFATPDHSWLVKYRDNPCIYWRETSKLQETRKHNSVYLMRPFGVPWAADFSYENGYLSGVFDGEGNLDGTCGVSFTQVQNSVLEKTADLLKNNGFSFKRGVKSINSTFKYKGNRQQCYDLRGYGLKNIFRFLGIVRPERLLNNFKKNVIEQTRRRFGKQLNCDPHDWIKVVRVFDAGEKEIAVLSTDIKTHFTGGFASHNTYSRSKSDGTSEEWEETIERCIRGAQRIGARYTNEEAERLFDYIFNLKGCFSGRMLWQLGTPLVDRFSANSLINCLAGETKVLTRKGWMFIKDLVDTSQDIVTSKGKWVKASFRCFGKQQLTKIVFKEQYSKNNITIFATFEHDWLLVTKKGKYDRVKTKDLKIGNIVPIVRGKNSSVYLSPQGIQHGLVYGDGSCNGYESFIDLIDQTYVECKKWFEMNRIEWINPKNKNHVRYGGLPNYYKKLPDIEENKPYLMGFLAGWIAADGYVSKNGQVFLFNKSREILERAKDIASVCGFRTNVPTLTRDKSPFDGCPSEMWRISFNIHDNIEILVIKEGYKNRINTGKRKSSDYAKIINIEPTNRFENVYCAIVPDTHSFVIDGNLLTGNCYFTNISEVDDFCFLFENLMFGGGVGFSVRREHIHELPKIKNNVIIKHECTKDADFIVSDSRDGWVELLRKTLTSFFVTGKGFTYSTILVRGYGEPIKTFGGTASGPLILIQGIENICKVIKIREGKKLRSVDALDVCNIIGSIVVAGNVRRSAQLALGDADDYLFLKAKRWDSGKVPNWRAMSNNTIGADDFGYISDLVWDGYNGNGEPYGFFNLKLCQEYGRIGEKRIDGDISGLNPCLTGDTLVYVADGRGGVSIKQLAQESKDVPVFCFNNKQDLTVRCMRNPRVTGKNIGIYKLKLEDGYEIKVTENHKFLLTSGEYKKVSELRNGDSLKTLTKFEGSFKDIFEGANSNSKDYFWIDRGRSKPLSEHVIMASFFYNQKIKTGFIVHHKDRNPQNNNFDNLEIMTKKDHDRLHSFDKIGDKNPMRKAKFEWTEEKWATYRKNMSESVSGQKNPRYSGFTNDQLKKHALLLTKKLNHRFSLGEWEVYAKPLGLPINFSKWRKSHLNGIVGLAKWAAYELGFEKMADYDPRIVKTYEKFLNLGYDCEIINNEVFINKNCEICGNSFKTSFSRPEIAMCSQVCCNKFKWNLYGDKIKDGMRKSLEKRHDKLKKQQALIFTDLRFKLGRDPQKKEWVVLCKEKGISSEISRKSSPFTSYSKLIEFASGFNHRVISVEFIGYDDVYNGTVDEFHNFFVGGWESRNFKNKRKWVYINNLQCGEIPLETHGVCNLSELFLNNISSKDELIDCAKLLYKTQKAVCALNYKNEKTNKIVHKNFRIGIGVGGICQSLDKIDWLNDCYLALRFFDSNYSKERGWPESIKLTTIKPSGTISLLSGASPGVHGLFSKYFIRRVRMASNDKLVSLCNDAGYRIEFQKGFDGKEDRNTVVVEFPCFSGEKTLTAREISAIQQLELVKKIQTVWADNAISCTVYYKKDELNEIKNWLKDNYENFIKSISFLLHSEHGFQQAPLEEIDKEKYEKILKIIKPIYGLSKIENGNSLDGIECINGACPIK